MVRCCYIDDVVLVPMCSTDCGKIMQDSELARPQIDASCSRIDVAHLGDLLIAFSDVRLLDAYSIYPVRA